MPTTTHISAPLCCKQGNGGSRKMTLQKANIHADKRDGVRRWKCLVCGARLTTPIVQVKPWPYNS